MPEDGMVSVVAHLLAWAGLAASFVVGLAAVLRMADPVPAGDDAGGAIHLAEPVTATVVALFALAALVFVVDLVRRGLSRRKPEDEEAERALEASRMPTWLRRLTQVLSLLNVAVLAYLVWRGAIPLNGLLFFGAGGLANGLGLPGAAGVSASPVLSWTFGILALLAGAGALALSVWVAFGDRPVREAGDEAAEPPATPLAAAVEGSLEELRSEPDPRRAIVRCYARFERAAADSGVERRPWLTPMEFMREALDRLPVPRAAVPTLTGLFELARFSHHPLGPRDRDRALEALDEIKAAIGRGGDASAS